MDTLPYVLTAYGLPHVMGYLPTKAGEGQPAPLSLWGLMEAAQTMGLAGVEIPLLSRVPAFDGKIVETAGGVEEVIAALRARGLHLIADYGALLDYAPQHTRDYLDLAAKSGVKVVRAILSHLLCGDRRKLAGGWEAHRDALAARLRELLPFAEERGLALALENHQDATTEDFWRLYEQTGRSTAFGVTLDTGNPLAVGQDPVEAAEKLAPLVRHVHLKDYTLHFAPEGYRLVRCANGDGVIDFPAILGILRRHQPDLIPGIEIAAQATRTVPLLEPDWWACYPERTATELLGPLRLLWEKGHAATLPYSTAWERGENSAAVSAEEWDVIRRSVAYFRTLA